MGAGRFVTGGTFCAFVCLVLFSRSSLAQTSTEVAARRELLRDATASQTSGDHARALELATRAGQIQMTPSLRLFIATEEAALGNVVQALGDAETCVHDAERDLAIQNRAAILSQCQSLAARLRPRIGRVVIRPPSNAPSGLHITVGGTQVSSTFYGVPFPVTAGAVAVEASADGRETFRTQVTVAPGATVDVPIAMAPSGTPTRAAPPVVESAPPDRATPPVVASASPDRAAPPVVTSVPPRIEAPPVISSAAPTRDSAEITAPQSISAPVPDRTNGASRTSRGISAGPIVVMTAGALGLAASAILFVVRNQAIADLETLCGGPDHTQCDASQEAQNRFARADAFNTATNIAWIGGTALLAGGLIWLVVDRVGAAHERSSTHAWLVPATGGGVIVGVGGSL